MSGAKRTSPRKSLKAAARWTMHLMSDDYQQRLLAGMAIIGAEIIARRIGDPRFEDAAIEVTGQSLATFCDTLLDRVERALASAPQEAAPPELPRLAFTEALQRHAWRRAARLQGQVGDDQSEAVARVQAATATVLYVYIAAPVDFLYSEPAVWISPERKERIARLADALPYVLQAELRGEAGATFDEKVVSFLFNGGDD